MTCASCVKAVENALSRLEGVHEVNVNFASEKATLKIDRDLPLESLIKA
ncbi:MAG TPA: heavy-metal-associated domain-containing protein, partial [Nitrospirae bacterium]|nr:heavy-metal-associated domain-containing protein [Nitrospirota bacterium]